MVVKIRWRYGPRVRRSIAWNRRLALILSTLMTPLALMAWALAAWRLMADLGWAGEFAIKDGAFSRWQSWTALAVGIQFAAFLLLRVSGHDEDRFAAD